MVSRLSRAATRLERIGMTCGYFSKDGGGGGGGKQKTSGRRQQAVFGPGARQIRKSRLQQMDGVLIFSIEAEAEAEAD